MSYETNVVERLAPPAARTANVPGLILREFQHRVANTLTILQVSFHLDFLGLADPGLMEKLRRHDQRIRDFADLHHFFSRGAGRGKIEAAEYFHALCALLSRSVLAPLGFHCEAYIGEGVLDGNACEWLALIVAELVMNAAKHAFPDCADGHVRIEIYASDAATWCCTVTDNGRGMRPASGGVGSQIVDALVQMLEGQMSIDTGRQGTAVTILLPTTRS